MRAEDQRAARRHVREILDEDRALLAQILDHIGVVHDFVTHVDGRAEQLDRALDDFDRAIDARAKAARLREQDFDIGEGVSEAHGYRIPMIFTSNASAWPASGWLKSNSADVSPTSFSTPA